MFSKLLSDLGIKGEECLYIGDDIEKDGACQELGISFLIVDKVN